MHSLKFTQDKKRNAASVQLVAGGQVVMTGHVFFGDMPADQYCSLSVQRPTAVEQGMIDDLKNAIVALTGNAEATNAVFESVFEKAA